MKEIMIDTMVLMMPIMKPFMWFSVAVAIIGVLLLVTKFALKSDYQKGILWSARLVIIAAVFFLAAQLAGVLLSMPPTINFGDSSKFEFILVSFWEIGLVLLFAGFAIKYLGGSNKTEVA